MKGFHVHPTPAKRAFTLVELLVVVSIIGLLVAILLPSLTRAREQARSAKCLAQLHGVGLAVVSYAAEYNDYLPGPLHPAIARHIHDFGEVEGDHGAMDDEDKQKSLIWLLRPYFQSGGSFHQESKVADQMSKCPTAALVAPDQDFYDRGGVLRRPFSYAINSYGPLSCPMEWNDNSAEWYHTDPPYYFGCWFYLDDWPESPAMFSFYRQRMWKPKNLAQIRFAGAEWSFGDAWYRRVSEGAVRPGTARDREFLGTFPSPDSGSPLPAAPYHGVKLSEARSTRQSGGGVLPKINFKGWTNLAYFDGHAEAFKGNWIRNGDGGTVNPYWTTFGGKRTDYDCPR